MSYCIWPSGYFCGMPVRFYQSQVRSLLPCLVSHSVSPLVKPWLMWPWRVKNHATSSCLTSCCQFWQLCCWHWNKTKVILLMPEQTKKPFVMLSKNDVTSFLAISDHFEKNFLLDPNPIISFPCMSLSHSLRACCETWLMWPWCACKDSCNLSKSRPTSHCHTCYQFWQPCCWCRNKTKAMLLMLFYHRQVI